MDLSLEVNDTFGDIIFNPYVGFITMMFEKTIESLFSVEIAKILVETTLLSISGFLYPVTFALTCLVFIYMLPQTNLVQSFFNCWQPLYGFASGVAVTSGLSGLGIPASVTVASSLYGVYYGRSMYNRMKNTVNPPSISQIHEQNPSSSQTSSSTTTNPSAQTTLPPTNSSSPTPMNTVPAELTPTNSSPPTPIVFPATPPTNSPKNPIDEYITATLTPKPRITDNLTPLAVNPLTTNQQDITQDFDSVTGKYKNTNSPNVHTVYSHDVTVKESIESLIEIDWIKKETLLLTKVMSNYLFISNEKVLNYRSSFINAVNEDE